MTRLAHLSGSEKAVETAAGSEVEHALAGTKCSNGLWVSASEAHVGALGHGRQLLCRVPELQARFGAGTAAAWTAAARRGACAVLPGHLPVVGSHRASYVVIASLVH